MLYPKQMEEKRLIRRRGNLAAVPVLLMLVMSYALGIVLGIVQFLGVDTGLSTYTSDGVLMAADPNRYLLTNLLFYIGVMIVPAVAGWLLLRGQNERLEWNRPLSAELWIGYLLVGMGICIFANVVAYGTTVVFSMFSLFPAEVAETADGTLGNWLLSVIGVALLPAIMEEFVFRGAIIGLLRPAGERVAILVSAVAFALAHGTLTQIPFAFVLGLAFGFLYVRSGNLLLTMILHFLNNAMAVTVESLIPVFGEEAVTVGAYLLYAVLALFGALATAYLRTRRDRPLQAIGQGASSLSFGRRLTAALCSAVMIIVLVWSALQLPANLEYDPTRLQEETAQQVQPGEDLFSGDGAGESAGVTWS